MRTPDHIATIARDTSEHVAHAKAAPQSAVLSWYRTLFPDAPAPFDVEAARGLVITKLQSCALVRIREEL